MIKYESLVSLKTAKDECKVIVGFMSFFRLAVFLHLFILRRVAAIEAACTSRTSDWRPLTRSQSVTSSSRMQQQAPHEAVPLTITKLTKKLRDREDEMFQL